MKEYHDMNIVLLSMSILSLCLGPLAFWLANGHKWALKTLDRLVILAILFLIFIAILPDVFGEIGWILCVPLLLGLFVPLLSEYFHTTLKKNTHKALFYLIGFGFILHGVVDGISIAIPDASQSGSHELPYAVVLHRIPVGLIIWQLFSPNTRRALFFFLGIVLATLCGYILSEYFVIRLDHSQIAYLEAFISGFLLHIVFHRTRH